MSDKKIFAIERPHPQLMKLYVIRSIFTGPFIIFSLPYLYFHYHTMRFRFDEEGISMSWGILFRKQVNLTYSRIQDIHLISGIIQRWLGLADLKIQTASGTSGAEMTLEGLLEYEEMREFLYSRMRGRHDRSREDGEKPSSRDVDSEGVTRTAVAAAPGLDNDALALLGEIHEDLRAARIAMEQLAAHKKQESDSSDV